MTRCLSRTAFSAAALLLCACGSGGGDTSGNGLSPAAALGEQLFNDTALSVSGQQSCATCHLASAAFTAGDGRAVPLGGPDMDLPGFRNAPSLMYASFTPTFFVDADGAPNGGFFRDGRAATLADQAQLPFITSFEMANADAAAVVARLKTRPYLAQFTALYGADVLDDPALALARIGAALAAYQTEDEDFHPFSSKYDAFTRGQVQFTTQETKGLVLFNDPTRGNCAACHPGNSADGGATPALFTDFSYDNLGVPRNTDIPANDDATTLSYVPDNGNGDAHRYYDLGICGPLREDMARATGNCGAFKVPTLRNIALTAPYFHNGRFATLQDALAFYVTRDTDPSRWYPTDADGNVTKFDDLEAIYGGEFTMNILVPGSDAGYVGNVNTVEIPYNRHLSEAPALDSGEIDAVIAFLCTLTDGFDPAHPDNYQVPAQCTTATTN